MEKKQREILIGTLLGDGNLQTFTNGNTWRARFIQKNKSYLWHLYEELKNIVGTQPREIDDGNGNKRWYFNTLVLKDGKELAELFYKKKGGKWKKVISEKLIDEVTPRSLAYWYMDDGNLKKVKNTISYRLCTDSYSLIELHILREVLRRYGIEVAYHKQRENQYRIYIPTKYKETWKNLIKGYIVEEMLYKIEEDHKT